MPMTSDFYGLYQWLVLWSQTKHSNSWPLISWDRGLEVNSINNFKIHSYIFTHWFLWSPTKMIQGATYIMEKWSFSSSFFYTIPENLNPGSSDCLFYSNDVSCYLLKLPSHCDWKFIVLVSFFHNFCLTLKEKHCQ